MIASELPFDRTNVSWNTLSNGDGSSYLIKVTAIKIRFCSIDGKKNEI